MPQASYPDADDLTALLASGALELDEEQVEQAVAAGIASFEGMVDRTMLAGAVQTRLYGPPANQFGLLDLEGDLATLTSIVYTPQNATPETILAADYRLEPQNAAFRNQPYERIAFQRRWWTPYGWGYGSAMAVTGAWGYGVTIPDDAWRAMLNLAVLWLLDMHLIDMTGLRLSWKEDDVHEDYGVEPGKQRAEGLRAGVNAAVARYRKTHLF